MKTRSLALPPAVLALLLCAPAAAQTSALLRSPATGLDLAPGASTASEELGAAGNPAALPFTHGLSLSYLHEENVASDLSADGVFLATPLFARLAAGFSAEWLRPPRGDAAPDSRRVSWALGAGSRAAAVGGAVHLLSFDGDGGASTWDLGLMLRPGRYVSLGVTAADLNSPSVAGNPLPRRYLGALGLRPLGELVTLTVDAEVHGGEGPGPSGLDHAAVAYGARLEPIPGLQLFGGVGHRVDGGELAFQAGLTAFTDNLALTAGGAGAGDHAGILAGARLSSASLEGLVLQPKARVAVVELDEALAPSRGVSLFPLEAREATLEVIEGLRSLAADDSVDAVLLTLDRLEDVGFGEAFEVREAMLALRHSGKKLVVLLFGADDLEYYLASAADQIWASKEAALLVNGLVARSNFYAETLGMIGVTVESVRIGKYKNAPDALGRSSISDEQKEVTEALLDDSFSRYVAAVSTARKFTPERFRELLEAGILSGAQAKAQGLVDEVVYVDELDDRLGKLLDRPAEADKVRLEPRDYRGWGQPPVIAVVPITGLITMGRSANAPFGLGGTTGAETVIEALEEAAESPEVKAIVLRVDSGGGDAHASDLIWRAAVKARKDKPVIASMGDVAASGGYYAAAGCERIFAAPGTITGSIGVFAMKPSLKGLTELLHVGQYRSVRGGQADLLNLYAPWAEGERAAMQRFIDAAYSDFLDVVAEARGMKKEAVHEVAQGRVWSGNQAKDRGLVDDLGGLAAALRFARVRAGIGPDAPVEYRVLAPGAGLLSFDGGSMQVTAPALELPAPLSRALRETIPPAFRAPGSAGVWALPEAEVRLQ